MAAEVEVQVDVRLLTRGLLLVVHADNPDTSTEVLASIADAAQTAGAALGLEPEQVWVTVGPGRLETLDGHELARMGLASRKDPGARTAIAEVLERNRYRLGRYMEPGAFGDQAEAVWENVAREALEAATSPAVTDRGEDEDTSGLSNLEVGGRRLTWREATEHHRDVTVRQGALLNVLHDLDRCQHGRHEGDDCSGCGGPSRGNPCADNRGLYAVRQIGYTLAGTPICVPERGHTQDPDAWTRSGMWAVPEGSTE